MVSLQDFLKVVIKRKDMAKWIEHEEYREGLKGAFVRVTYHKQYLVAMIDGFKVGIESYKVEQRETKLQVVLSNRGKLKQFKINMVSDREPTEQEFIRMQQDNPSIKISQYLIKDKIKEIKKANKFQYKKDELDRLVNEQNYKKIKARNFKGLNMTSIKMTLQGELAMAAATLADAENEND